jgi:DNA-directed RNA polymerase specialized sigma24 family protein
MRASGGMDNRKNDPVDDLLERLDPDLPDRDARYKQLRLKIFKFFEWRRCKEESWALADETIARLVEKVNSGVYVRSYSYVYTIAQFVLKERWRALQKEEKILNNWRPPDRIEDPEMDCKKQCLERLSHDKRELLVRYYSGKETSEQIAEEMGTSVENLRLRIHREKKKLRKCCDDCIKESGIQ